MLMPAGLGLPWVIATIYYEVRDQRYETPAGDLSFSVLIFMVRTDFECVGFHGHGIHSRLLSVGGHGVA